MSITSPLSITVGVTIPNEKDGSLVQITIGQRTVSISIVRSSILGTGYPLGVTHHRQESITSLYSHCTVIVSGGGRYWDYQNPVPSKQVLYTQMEEHSTVVYIVIPSLSKSMAKAGGMSAREVLYTVLIGVSNMIWS